MFYRVTLAIVVLWAFGLGQRGRSEELPEVFESTRPLGMGGAFTAIANDQAALWTNPAGAARARKAWARNSVGLFRLPEIILGANSEGKGFYDAFSASTEKNAQTVIDQGSGIADKPIWFRAAAAPAILFGLGGRNGIPMAIAGYTHTAASIVVDPNSTGTARVNSVSDAGGLLNVGWSTESNRFNFGMQFRGVYRYAYEDAIPTSELTSTPTMKERFAADANTSTGFGVDAGLLMTLADFWFPTLGVAAFNLPVGCREDYLNPFSMLRENVCGTVYSGSISNPDAMSIVDPTDFRVGVSITPRLGRSANMRFAIDAHHLALASGSNNYGLVGVEPIKLVHAGAEFFWGNPLLPDSPFSVRAGMAQGFVTAGATVKLLKMSFEFATFGRDVSTDATPKEDRRYQAAWSFEF